MANRITRTAIEVMSTGEGSARVTRSMVELMLAEPTDMYVTRSMVEWMVKPIEGADYLGSHTDAGDWTA